LSREDHYELVWSKPMVELARDLGMSDVALAKRCRELGVPEDASADPDDKG
jgi:hypothetical protein